MKRNLLQRKAIRAVLLALLLSALGMRSAWAEDFVYNNLKYRITGTNTVTLIGHELGNQASGLLMLTSYAYNNGKCYSVTKIGASAFSGCTQLSCGQILVIPSSVTSIGNFAFSGCTGFAGSLTISNSVTDIGLGAFSGCTNFNLILTISESVANIGITAFDGTSFGSVKWNAVNCNDFTTLSGHNGPFENTGISRIYIGPNVERIPARAFYGCSQITAITSQASVPPVVGANALSGINTNRTVTVPCGTKNAYQATAGWSAFNIVESNECEYIISGLADPTNAGSVSGSGTYSNGTTCTLTAMPNPGYSFVVWTENGAQVSTNATYTFTASCDRLLVAHFQQQLYTIGVSYFPSAGGSITGGGTFNYGASCTVTATPHPGFLFVNWTENGNQVSTDAIYSFNVTDSRILVANFVLEQVGSEQIVFADANVKAVCVANWDTNGDGELSYAEAAAVTSVERKFEKNTTITSFDEFQYFTGVTELVGGYTSQLVLNQIITSPYGAFHGCSNLTSLTIPETVTTIGRCVFYSCASLTSIEIPAQVASIGERAFSGCSGLASMSVLAEVPPTLGNNVFYNVNKAIPVYVPCFVVGSYQNATGWNEFGNYQGIDCIYHQITAVANLTGGGAVVGDGIYVQGANCTLTAISNQGFAFVNWTENDEVVSTNATYSFTVTEERSLVANFNQTNPEDIINFADANVKALCVANWDTNGDGELSYDEAAAVTTLGNVFSRNTTITSFNELQYFTGLTSINGYYSYVYVGNNTMQQQPFGAFVRCVNLTSVIIPNTVTSLSVAFSGCESLSSIVIPGSVSSIGKNSFYQCTGLTALEIGSSVLTIGDEAFYGCSNLASLTVHAVTPPTLGTNVFYNVIKNIPVNVYFGTIPAYQAALGWSEFSNYQGMAGQSNEITVTINPIEGGTVTGSGIFSTGETCTLTAIANTGYYFLNWTENGVQVSVDASYSFSVSESRHLVANFTNNFYISFADANVKAICVANWDTNGDGELSNDEAAAVTDLGTVFKNNQTITSFNELQYFTGLTTIHGHNSKEGNGGIVTPNSAFYNCKNLTSIIIPENVTSIGGNAFTFCQNLASIEIPSLVTSINDYAFTYCNSLATITVHAETPPSLGINVFTVNRSIPVYVPCGTASAYQAASGWSDFTNYQELECPAYEITATASPTMGGIVEGAGNYNGGENCTLTAMANEGYSFVNWTENGNVVSSDSSYSFIVMEARTLVANFINNGHEITASANPSEGGTIEGAGSYLEGGICTLTATANNGYSFVNWTENGNEVSTSAVYTFPVTTERTLVANFSLNSYEIVATPNPAEGGQITGSGNYYENSSCTLTATANEGYTFANWTEDGNVVSTDVTYTFTVTEAKTLVANFSLNSYEITASANPTTGGVAIGDGTYTYGSSCVMTAIANEGYTFINWTENGNHVSTDAEYTFTVTGTRTLVANFSLNIYTVSVLANQAEGGTVTGGGSYNHGTSCTLTATANTGYTFVSWTKDGITVSTDPEYCFTVTEAATYIAEFETDEVTSNHWIPQSANYADNMALYCVIMIHGEEQTSDQLEVGAFCGDECRGSAMASLFEITNRYLVVLMVFGNNGDQIQFKLYDHATGQELNYTSSEIVTFQEDGYGTPLEPYVLDFVDNAQNRALIAGWNWYSTYIEQNGIDGLTMLENSLGTSGIRIQGRNGMVDYFEYQGDSYWYGSLNSIANEQMYKIRTSEACDAVMVGYLASAANHPITINNGWNWIGFPSNQSVSVTTALSGFTPEADDIIKGRNGMAAYVAGSDLWYGTLNMLEPGQGYMYKSNANTAKTLTINTERGENMIANMTSENNIFIPNDAEFASNMLVTAVVDMEGNELHSEDYEIASFVGDECRGSVKLMYVEPIDRYVAFLLVFGEANEDIHFALTDGTETRWSNTTMVYSADAIIGTLSEPTTICFGTMGVNDNTGVTAVIYPNPTKDLLNIKCEGLNQIELVNAYGQQVLTKQVRTDNLQIDLGNLAPGIYLLRLCSEIGMTTKQIIKQ